MTKKIVISLVIVVALFLIDRVFFAPEREKNSRINNEIYASFRAIENYCRSYVQKENVNQTELKRCEEVVAQAGYCGDMGSTDQTPSGCYADEYYKHLQSLGFKLPKLYNEKGE